MLDEALEILRDINARGRLAVVVGGAVRDMRLGRPLTDIRTLLHDLLLWMYQAGHLDAAQAGPALVAEAERLQPRGK